YYLLLSPGGGNVIGDNAAFQSLKYVRIIQ
ncbi:MAG: hypothetical protein ACI9XJ_002337, partial [Marivirga sp.]